MFLMFLIPKLQSLRSGILEPLCFNVFMFLIDLKTLKTLIPPCF